MATETRLDRVEGELEAMTARVRRLELLSPSGETRRDASRAPSKPPSPPRPAPLFEPPPALDARGVPRDVATAPRDSAPGNALDFERLFGGRVLAWIGGLAILFAAVLFVGMAISRGWIDEETRTIVAALGALALLVGGVWLHERHGRTEAARAAVAAGISGLFATTAVAAQGYDLISPELGLVLSALVAATGVALAIRWDAPVVAAVGLLGALGSPAVVTGELSASTMAFVLAAQAASTVVLAWRRWNWLGLGAFAISAAQLLAWLFVEGGGIEGGTIADLSTALPLMIGFWVLWTLGAIAFELRTHSGEPFPLSSWAVLSASCAFVVSTGHGLLTSAGDDVAATFWLFGFAAVYVALGGAALRLRINREVGALLIGLGIALSAFGFASALDGPALVAAWAAESAALAFLATRVRNDPTVGALDSLPSSRERVLLAAAVLLTLAIGHVLTVEAPPSSLLYGVESLGTALGAIAACAAAALVLARCARSTEPAGALSALAVGATSLVYLGSVAIVDRFGVDSGGEVIQSGQVWLSAFWTVTGLGAVVWGLVRRQASVRLGGLALLGVAIAKVWTYDLAELEELARVLSFVGLGLLLLVGAFAYGRIKPDEDEETVGSGPASG